MEKKVIKILIVDDSRVARELLKHVFESDPELKVVGTVEDGQQALKWLETHTCDVISMDIHMPHLNGFEVTARIIESTPLPIAIISSGYTPTDNLLAFKAMEVGALAILEKPGGIADTNYERKAKEIINTIKMISEVKVITRHKKRSFGEIGNLSLKTEQKSKIKAVGIGASLGGPMAIATILEMLPKTFPVPIFIVQHIVAGFTETFIRWLQEQSNLPIHLAKDGEFALPGNVYIAPNDCHMEIKKGNLVSLDFTKTSGIQPSVSRLFSSLAETYGPRCVGVILTGMGKDGAAELLLMKQNGAHTIAQDSNSCVMFGMPKEAISLGAAKEVLPLEMIAPTLNDLVT